MSKKIEISGKALTVTDTVSGLVELSQPTTRTWYKEEDLKNGRISFYDLDSTEDVSGNFSAIALTGAVDSSLVAFTESTFRSFCTNKLGVSESDVILQDSTSPLMIVRASKIVVETTITSITAIDDYTIDVTSATSFLVGQYLTIYNAVADRVYFSNILSINVLEITLDTPLDFEFPIGSFVSVGDTDLAVNGSVTPQIFGIRNPTGVDIPLSFDVVRLMFKCLTSAAVDLSKFGDIVGGITRGLVVRRVDGTTQNIFNAKTNAQLKNIMFDFDIEVAQGNAQDGFTGRFTFGGQNRMGAVIRIGSDEDLQIVIQDDLSSLGVFTIVAEGSQVIK